MASKDDLTYKSAYDALSKAQQSRNQADVDTAKQAIGALKGTSGEFGIGEFSKQLDGVQQGLINNNNYMNEQTSKISSMYDSLKSSQISQANAQRQQAQEQLRRQLAEKLPQYQTQRAQADVGQQQNFNKLKEYMASAGAFNSGDNLSRAGNILVQRQNAVNQINGDQNAYEVGVNNSLADADRQYASAVNSINSQFDAQKAQALMNLQNQLRQENYQQGRDTVADNRYNQQFQYQQSRDNVTDTRYNDQFDYQKIQDALQQYNQNRQFVYQQGRDNVADTRWNTEFDYTKSRDTVRDNQWQSQFDYTKQSDIDNRNFQASQAQASRIASTAKSDAAAKEKESFNNLYNTFYRLREQDPSVSMQFLSDNRGDIISRYGADTYEDLVSNQASYAKKKQEEDEARALQDELSINPEKTSLWGHFKNLFTPGDNKWW